MQYRSLSEELRPVADACARYFNTNWGVSKFKAEEQLDPDIERCPTLQAVTSDGHYLCVEVSESPYPTGLDSFVLDCRDHILPVRLFVAIPAGSKSSSYKSDIDRARGRGVGVLEVSQKRVQCSLDALSLSLAGVRPVEASRFPKKYRLALSQAESTFRRGEPVKGCSLLYDEIEAFSRKIAKKTHSKGYWLAPKPGSKPVTIRFDTHPWERLIELFMKNLDPQKCKFFGASLLGRVLGITQHRNDSAHKKTLAAVKKRDRELRTRFESATDTFFDLVTAAKPLRM